MKTTFSIPTLLLAGFLFDLSGHVDDKTSPSRSGHQYYIAPNGSDANSGSSDHPWQTLDKANKTLKPGDTVILRDGTYGGILSPAATGESAARAITYRSENRHSAVLTGKSGTETIINLKGKHFITVDGFKMLPEVGGFGLIEGCSHITIQDCHMEYSTKIYCPLELINCPYTRVSDCTLTRHFNLKGSTIHGDSCHIIDSPNSVIERNDFAKSGHNLLRIWCTSPMKSSHTVVRGNCFHNGWGRNFAMLNLDRCLFEDNITTDAFNGAGSADAQSKFFLIDSIIRNNLTYDNWGVIYSSKSYSGELSPVEGPLLLKNSRIYNNTFANNPAFVWEFSTATDGEPIKANLFVNNLFYRNDYAGIFNTLMMARPGTADDNLFFNNLFYGEKPNQAGVHVRDQRYTATALNQQLPARFKNNLDADPLFDNLPARCFTLGSGSPAINAGRFLTQAIGAGTGTHLEVSDARFFYDGFGIGGEQGDLVAIGKGKALARVLKTDISRNVLTLDREVSWQDGDPVSLPYAGTAPDIGARQHGDTGTFSVVPRANPVHVKPGDPVSFTTIISGAKDAVKPTWNFGDDTTAGETNPKHTYSQPGDYIVRLCCTDASGATRRGMVVARVSESVDPKAPMMRTGFEPKEFEDWGYLWDHGARGDTTQYRAEAREDGQGQCLSVSAAGKNSALAVTVKLRAWDIDQYPYISFDYRIPKDVPVGTWVTTWPVSSRTAPPGTSLGGSPAHSAGKFKSVDACRLIDDGQWHKAVIDVREARKVLPNLKLAYSFEFATQAKPVAGQQFWFDEFAITPNLPDRHTP